VRHNLLTYLMAKNLDAGMHLDGKGLWLIKRSRDSGKWVQRFFLHGRRREMGLGPWPEVSIAEARDLAGEIRRTVRLGDDPILARQKARNPVEKVILKEVIRICFEARKAELKKDGEAGRWMNPLKVHIIPKIGRYPVDEIDQHVLCNVLKPIWHDKPDAAEKALQRVGLALKHAAAMGLTVDLQATMKARALMGKQRRTRVHIPSMDYADAPAFYQWLAKQDTVAAQALRLLMLTIGRTSEIRLAAFPEIEADIWQLAAERTKNGLARRVPLVGEAQLTVAARRKAVDGDFLFPAYKGQPITDAAMAALMKREGLEARPHGFRATFRTWVEEQTDAAFEVKEACLGHVVDTGVVGAYQRSDRLEKRRALLEQWEAYLLQPLKRG
jgi:integrase